MIDDPSRMSIASSDVDKMLRGDLAPNGRYGLGGSPGSGKAPGVSVEETRTPEWQIDGHHVRSGAARISFHGVWTGAAGCFGRAVPVSTERRHGA